MLGVGMEGAGYPGQRLTGCGCLPRVYGSYEHLWAGQVADALVDLTGGLAERWSLKDLARTGGRQDRPGGSEHRTCRQLLSLKDRCLISCSVLSPRAGETQAGGGLGGGQRERPAHTCVFFLRPRQGRVESKTFVLESWCLVCDCPRHPSFSGGRCPLLPDSPLG